MKKIYFLFIFITILNLTSCDSVIVGQHCYFDNYNLTLENEDFIVSGRFIYNKKENTFIPLKDNNQLYYSIDKPKKINLNSQNFTISYTIQNQLYLDTFSYLGELLSTTFKENVNEESIFIEEGFYSTYNRINYDTIDLTDDERSIWEYAKTKSLKDTSPYFIEGYLKETSKEIYFNVNVYNKIMWKGSALVNQGIYSSSLNRFDKESKQIEELLSLNQKAIKHYNENYLFYFNKLDKSIYYYDLNTNQEYKICKNNEKFRYYSSANFLIAYNLANENHSKIYFINKDK